MELSRRDALLAVLGSGVAAGAGSIVATGLPADVAGLKSRSASERERVLSADEREALMALAEVVYPSEVEVTEGFLETYVGAQPDERRAGFRRALSTLEDRAAQWTGRGFAALPAAKRDALLREMGVDRVQPDREGTATQRVRYYLVNGLLYALFTVPKGSELVGIENPKGYPGGFQTMTKPRREP